MKKPTSVSALWKRGYRSCLFWLELPLIAALIIVPTLILTSSASQSVSANKALQAHVDYSDPSAVCTYGPGIHMHIHMHLSIYVNDERIVLPGGVGIHVGHGRTCYYWLHTHDSSGVVHVEAPSQHTFILGDFLTIWDKHFHQQGYPEQLNLSGWQVYINGKAVSSDFYHLPMSERLLVTLTYHSPQAQPDRSYNWPGNF
jgi:hypothetical protein